jgi:hypothetical protein
MNKGLKVCLGAVLCVALAGCWNGENVHVNMGTVSIGQQLLDLKAAANAGAMSQEEYQLTREKILSLVHGCGDSSAASEDEAVERDEDQAALSGHRSPGASILRWQRGTRDPAAKTV